MASTGIICNKIRIKTRCGPAESLDRRLLDSDVQQAERVKAQLSVLCDPVVEAIRSPRVCAGICAECRRYDIAVTIIPIVADAQSGRAQTATAGIPSDRPLPTQLRRNKCVDERFGGAPVKKTIDTVWPKR